MGRLCWGNGMDFQQWMRPEHKLCLALQPAEVSSLFTNNRPVWLGLARISRLHNESLVRVLSIDKNPTQPVRLPTIQHSASRPGAVKVTTGSPEGTQPIKVPGGRAARDRVLNSLGDTSPHKVTLSSASRPINWAGRAVAVLLVLSALAALAALTFFLYNWFLP